MTFDFDLIVIGAGAAGLTCAITAKGFGKSVLLIEKNRTGGECTWSGCVPSKALINISKEINSARKYCDFVPDTRKIMKDVKKVIEDVYSHETPEVLEKTGINFLEGEAEFTENKTIKIGENTFSGKSIIIATGSSPFVPPIPGINTVEYLTNESLFLLEEIPKSMIILGGGAIGVEMAQALNRIGVEVHLVEMLDNILFREDQEFAHILREKLIDEGVNIHIKTKAVEVKKNNNTIILTVEKDGQKSELSAESMLVAVGRKPSTASLKLENAGIEYNKKGIEVDKHLETNIHNIYAVGDVVGPYQFSHMANYQGIIAVQNALTPLKKSIDYSNVAWTTFTQPELASAGMSEKEAREKHDNIHIYSLKRDELDRAKTKKDDIFNVKIICDHKKKILGAQILADRAGELICEIQAMKSNGLSLDKLAGVIHPYPTYAEAFSKLGKKAYVDKLMDNPVVSLIKSIKH
ncbi:dihydrolipoyl dehydrogenase family protein [Ilyobacter polytropus]|uniref:FAD-dependent pyridine nucleotide-disulfide oxidoreductase n=1 Tax=Ilyobacter polytropus (strain ATCC 51220 / DSM 2926 / LMG 16218 / CuHBu1) TaxID=572544 RepID=E3HCF1_ILYPC|nr:NAD(P)/FAD-dependent oxidoreductase [Ilyobacter polytropus]ADO84411.1 FAD-dependent pyridine nucleotide-disulfide oxidoreductase [Ilyobacter polytropus DSM 2926]